jgi:glycine cleavage system H protein
MVYPEERRYTKEHEWAKIDGDEAVIGITFHAQDELGDVVFVDLPKVGDTLRQMKTFGAIESVKAVSDLYAPVSGTVVRVNTAVIDKPELVNQDPHGNGWLVAVRMPDPKEAAALLSAAEYTAYVDEVKAKG